MKVLKAELKEGKVTIESNMDYENLMDLASGIVVAMLDMVEKDGESFTPTITTVTEIVKEIKKRAMGIIHEASGGGGSGHN